jgi:hypothetical protein
LFRARLTKAKDAPLRHGTSAHQAPILGFRSAPSTTAVPVMGVNRLLELNNLVRLASAIGALERALIVVGTVAQVIDASQHHPRAATRAIRSSDPE